MDTTCLQPVGQHCHIKLCQLKMFQYWAHYHLCSVLQVAVTGGAESRQVFNFVQHFAEICNMIHKS